MKKNLLLVFIWITIFQLQARGTEYLNNDSSVYNFAQTILFPEDKNISILKIFSFLDDSLKLKFKNGSTLDSLLGNRKYMSVITSTCGLAYSELTLCGKTDSAIIIRREPFSTRAGSRPLVMQISEIWMVILEPMMDKHGKLNATYQDEKNRFSSLLDAPFITNTSFFSVPREGEDHAIKLGTFPRQNMSIPYTENVTPDVNRQIEDIKKLSSLFCGKKYEFLDGIENIQKIIPSLQTDIGKLIAKKMIEILETKAIDAAKAAQNIGDTTKVLK